MDELLRDVAQRHMPDRARPPPEHQKAIVKMIEGLSRRHSPWQVFADFVEMSAITFSNTVDLAQRDAREARYMEVVKRYDREEINQFPKMLAELVEALEAEPGDVLGRVFHDLELHNHYQGQFFTPDPVCRLMAEMTMGDKSELQERIASRGYVTASEPACGSGAMVIALANAMKAADVNYQQALHVTAVDVDLKCVHMAYVQFSLLHIPAVIVHGDSLRLEEYSHWYTPAHILGGWTWKLRLDAFEAAAAPASPAPLSAPDLELAPADDQPQESDEPLEDLPSQVTQLTLF